MTMLLCVLMLTLNLCARALQLGKTALDMVADLKPDRKDRWAPLLEKLAPMHTRRGQSALVG